MANGTIITSKKARPRLGASAQARWMRRQQEKGNCRACGKPRPATLKQLCEPCQAKANSYMKRYRAAKKAAALAAIPATPVVADVVAIVSTDTSEPTS